MADPHNAQLASALSGVLLPKSITIRTWNADDFPAIQELSSAEGWFTPNERPSEAFAAWQQARPALVAMQGDEMIGFLRAITDGSISTYVCELLVERQWRGKGIGRGLIAVCHNLYPTTRIDLLAGEEVHTYYEYMGFTPSYGYRKRRLV